MRFQDKLINILHDRGEVWRHLEDGCGVSRRSIYRGIRSRSIIAAISYHLNMDAEELVKDTELEEIWNDQNL